MTIVWPTKDEKEIAALRRLWDESDRAAAIIAATILEDRLERKIKAHLRNDVSNVTLTALNDIFRPSGPLGSFSMKIDFGYLLALYDGIVRREWVTVKDIRNAFAHKLEALDFETDSISGLSNNFRIADLYVLPIESEVAPPLDHPGQWATVHREVELGSPKRRYLTTCSLYAKLLTWHADRRMPAILGDGPSP